MNFTCILICLNHFHRYIIEKVDCKVIYNFNLPGKYLYLCHIQTLCVHVHNTFKLNISLTTAVDSAS